MMKSQSLPVALALAAAAGSFAISPAAAPASVFMPKSFGWTQPKRRKAGKSEHARRIEAWLVKRNFCR